MVSVRGGELLSFWGFKNHIEGLRCVLACVVHTTPPLKTKQRKKKKKKNKLSQSVAWNLRTKICWKILESAACAFGWINPLLRQMAPSPCWADKPHSACHPLLHCVFVCTCARAYISPKKDWQSDSGEDGGWICFGSALLSVFEKNDAQQPGWWMSHWEPRTES